MSVSAENLSLAVFCSNSLMTRLVISLPVDCRVGPEVINNIEKKNLKN